MTIVRQNLERGVGDDRGQQQRGREETLDPGQHHDHAERDGGGGDQLGVKRPGTPRSESRCLVNVAAAAGVTA